MNAVVGGRKTPTSTQYFNEDRERRERRGGIGRQQRRRGASGAMPIRPACENSGCGLKKSAAQDPMPVDGDRVARSLAYCHRNGPPHRAALAMSRTPLNWPILGLLPV